MNDSVLTRERILEAAEDVLRRFGPAKATVVDVARALGVSHGSVYRHFRSKAALRDAVAEVWLARLAEPLAELAAEKGPSPARLRRWFDRLIASKRKRAHDDPELFATYVTLVAESRDVVKAHVDHLVDQITHILVAGVAEGAFIVSDPASAARAVFHATTRFHDP
ncbi:MAG: TetR family transcriptional regulator, partial [Anaerolineae bacterium]|nr:TetR family transcriptional regulator [Anaerolineae bacterium]